MNRLLLFLFCFCLFSCAKENVSPDAVAPVTDEAATNSQITSLKSIVSEKLEGEFLVKQSANPQFNNRLWQGIPSVTVSNKGVIFVAWYSGAKGEEPGNYITLSVSTDNGQTWKNDELIINPTNDNVRFFDPSLWTDKFGNVFLSWSKSKKVLWDGVGGVWNCQITYVKDRINHSTATRLGDGVMMCRPTENIEQTGTFYPIAVWKTATTNNGVYIYKSTYNTKLKKSEGFVKTSTIPFDKSLRSYDEHQIIQLKDKSYYVMLRGIDGLYFSTSKDMKVWTTAKKFNTILTTSSRFFLGRLASGKIALVLSNSTVRSDLKIYLSEDEMKTWKYSMMLDVKPGVSYPDLSQDKDGTIHLVYDFDRFGKMAINHLTFTEDDVINNSTVGINRSLISGKP
jgi:hypothetical protein